MKEFVFFSQESLTFYGVTPSSFMEEGFCPLFMGSRRFPSETEGEGGALLACYDLFFPLGSQTALIWFSFEEFKYYSCISCNINGIRTMFLDRKMW